MMMSSRLVGGVVLVALVMCWQPAVRAGDAPLKSSAARPLSVSLIQLIARADDFEGEYVRVMGFYRDEHEGTALYLHREDYEQGLTKNALWVHRQYAEHNMKYVLVEGRFTAKTQGHMNLFSGELGPITRIMAWPPPTTRPAH